MRRPRSGLLMLGLAAAGVIVAAYLAITKLANAAPACGPLEGCETVASSQYSVLFGIPVAVYGVAFSAVLVGLALAWWRREARGALLALYGLGLIGTLVIAGLTYLELFVIHAVCVYCVAYGITVIFGFAVAARSLRSSLPADE